MLIQNRQGVCPGGSRSWLAEQRGGRSRTASRRPALRRWALCAGAVLVVMGAAGMPPVASPVWVERETYLMGSPLMARVAAVDRAAGVRAIEAVFDAVRRAEGSLTTWRDDGEIQRLNRAVPGAWIDLGPPLLAVLEEVQEWRLATAGAFDPGIGPLVDAWDLRGAGRVPTARALAGARAASGLHHFTFDAARGRAARGDSASWIDTGGFGKGAALRDARAALRRQRISAAFVNFGGHVLALGRPADGQGWPVSVAHPVRRDEPVAHLVVADRSAATSSQSERVVEAAGRRIGHLLDPRNGMPVAAWGSVTVVAHDPLEADILSTALFVLGPEAGWEWLAARNDVAALFLVIQDGVPHVRWTRAMEAYLVEAQP